VACFWAEAKSLTKTYATKWVVHQVSLRTLTFFSVLATQSIANVVKSSLGPVGLDKMLVDDIGVYSHLFSSLNV
jgi:hypothetical protein